MEHNFLTGVPDAVDRLIMALGLGGTGQDYTSTGPPGPPGAPPGQPGPPPGPPGPSQKFLYLPIPDPGSAQGPFQLSSLIPTPHQPLSRFFTLYPPWPPISPPTYKPPPTIKPPPTHSPEPPPAPSGHCPHSRSKEEVCQHLTGEYRNTF